MTASLFSKQTQSIVAAILKRYPEVRDNNCRLIANVWYREVKDKIDSLSARELLGLVGERKLTSPESITRCSRKLQEDHPELRGKLWTRRQSRANKVRKEIAK